MHPNEFLQPPKALIIKRDSNFILFEKARSSKSVKPCHAGIKTSKSQTSKKIGKRSTHRLGLESFSEIFDSNNFLRFEVRKNKHFHKSNKV